jgi:hypothetical protein
VHRKVGTEARELGASDWNEQTPKRRRSMTVAHDNHRRPRVADDSAQHVAAELVVTPELRCAREDRVVTTLTLSRDGLDQRFAGTGALLNILRSCGFGDPFEARELLVELLRLASHPGSDRVEDRDAGFCMISQRRRDVSRKIGVGTAAGEHQKLGTFGGEEQP